MKKQIQLLIMCLIITLSGSFAAKAQIASGGQFTLDQSVIASGGGKSAEAGTTFSLSGTIGQSIAGTSSTNNPFSVAGGFWIAPAFAPTAASVSVAGRVMTPSGRGIINVHLSLTDGQGNVRIATTTSFGYYHFDDVEVGVTYILTATGKHFTFSQPTQVLNINEESDKVNFIASSEKRIRVF